MTFDLQNCEIFLLTFHKFLRLFLSTLLLTYIIHFFCFSYFCKNSKKKLRPFLGIKFFLAVAAPAATRSGFYPAAAP